MDQVLITGRSPDNQPRPVRVDANGNLYTTPAAAASDAVRLVDVAGDSCMDEVNNAARVNVVAGAVGGGPATIADGADVTQGANADAAITADLAGTASSKLRGLVKWAYERMPASLGQKTKLLSLPVTLASDEDALAVTGTFYPGTQPVSVADGSDAAEGTTTDAASATATVEDNTARTGIGLWKGIKNVLKLINDKLVTGTVIGNVNIGVGDQAIQLDDTDKLAVSVYGTDAAVGDTPLPVDATYGVRISHPNATSATTDADADTNNAPLTDVGNVLRYWARLWAFNGTTWDRLRKDATGALRVSLYGKDSAAGDKELSVSGAGNLEVIASGPFTAVLSADAVAASTMYQLIDLSDAANYPHTATGQIVLKRLRLNCEKDTVGIFRVKVGIVIENDGTDGSATWLHTFHLEANGNPTDGTDRFASPERTFDLDCEVSGGALVNYVSNDALAASALLKNDVARTSPVGTANPGVGDLMVYVEEITNGGTIDFTVSADYDTL